MHDGLIYRYAEGQTHLMMLRLTRPRCVAYCNQHGFDLEEHEEKGFFELFGWRRWEYMLDAFRRGYQYAVYIETDSLIVDMKTDLRLATGDKPLGMVYGQATGGEIPHYQCGVIYGRNTPRLIEFLEFALSFTPPADLPVETGPWWDRHHNQQALINKFLKKPEWADICAKLDYRWNRVGYLLGYDPAVVLSWHGWPSESDKLDMLARYV